MLVLTRKIGEKIQIGENIFITVVDIDRSKIKLGVDAPREVSVYRTELLTKPITIAPTPRPATFMGRPVVETLSNLVSADAGDITFGAAPSMPGCAKACAGQDNCTVGWADGSCGAKPYGTARPPRIDPPHDTPAPRLTEDEFNSKLRKLGD